MTPNQPLKPRSILLNTQRAQEAAQLAQMVDHLEKNKQYHERVLELKIKMMDRLNACAAALVSASNAATDENLSQAYTHFGWYLSTQALALAEEADQIHRAVADANAQLEQLRLASLSV